MKQFIVLKKHFLVMSKKSWVLFSASKTKKENKKKIYKINTVPATQA